MSDEGRCLCCGKHRCGCAKTDQCPVAGYCVSHCRCEKCVALRETFARMRAKADKVTREQEEEIERLQLVAHNNANVVRDHKGLIRLLSHEQKGECWCLKHSHALAGPHGEVCQQVREALGVKDE